MVNRGQQEEQLMLQWMKTHEYVCECSLRDACVCHAGLQREQNSWLMSGTQCVVNQGD